MEEQIIKAQFTKNKLARIVAIVGIALIVLGLIVGLNVYLTKEQSFSNYVIAGVKFKQFTVSYKVYFRSFGNFLFNFVIEPWRYFNATFVYVLYLGVLSVLAAGFFAWQRSRCALTVTNRRVTGKASFGKSVDLPLNQISAVGLGACNSITVATSSGKIHFWFVKNRDEVHTALTDIIGKVQVESVYAQSNAPVSSDADELKKYKDLLDSGAITQEEFDAKKKQILGL